MTPPLVSRIRKAIRIMTAQDEPLSPGCMKCETVTGKVTCFPALCIFYCERNIHGTKAFQVALLDQIRRGRFAPVRTS